MQYNKSNKLLESMKLCLKKTEVTHVFISDQADPCFGLNIENLANPK